MGLDIVPVEVDKARDDVLAVGVDSDIGVGVDATDRDDAVPLDAATAIQDRLRRDDTAVADGDGAGRRRL